MYCGNCGNPLAAETNICPACGPPPPAPSPAVEAPPVPAAVVADKAKAASRDALQALKIIAPDPVGGLATAFASVGPTRALGVGVAFGAAFAVGGLCGMYRFLTGWGGPHGFTGFLQLLLVAVVPPLTLTAAVVAARKALRGEGSLGQDAFVAGASLLPFGGVAVSASILGPGNVEVIGVFAAFAFCLTILVLFAGLTRVCAVSERAATWALPLILIASGWLSKVIYAAMLEHM